MAHGPPARKKPIDGELHEGEEDEDEQPIPPDGGWGWWVVFGSFMIHVITDGMTYSFGLFLGEFLEEFKQSNSYTSWIISLLAGVTLCSGPISSSFVNRYGCRKVTIAGAVLAAISLVASSFAQNVLTLIVTAGVCTGLGLGLIYLPAIVSVTTYFEKYRSLATGIAVCGSGFGTFLFAPLTEWLIREYTWRGALQAIAGIVLHCVLFGALFRPLVAKKRDEEEGGAVAGAVGEEMYELNSAKPSNGHLATEADPVRRSSLHKASSFKSSDGANGAMTRSQSVGHSLVKNGHGRSAGHQHRVHYDDNHNGNGNGNGNAGSRLLSNGSGTGEALRSALSQPFLNDAGDRLHFKSSHRSLAKSGTMSRPDILYQGSLYNIANYRSTHDVNGGGIGDGERYGSFRRVDALDAEADAQSTVSDNRKCCGCVPVKTRDTFMEMMNFDLFADPIFVVFTLSNFCTSIGFNVPYVYLTVQAESYGISKTEASYLLAIIGIANTVGRIALGYVSDKPWVNRLTVYNVCLTSCGIATVLSVFCTTFVSLAFFSAFFGFTIGAYVGLTSVILVDLLSLEKLTNAFGLLLLFQGIASLIGPPMAGALYDLLRSYSPGFILAGVTIAVSGFILFAIPPMQRHLARRLEQRRVELENAEVAAQQQKCDHVSIAH